jgi:hypothetical protein
VELDEPEYEDKLDALPEFRVSGPLPKDPTGKVERKIHKLLSRRKTALSADQKHKLTPYHSKHPHLYGLPKVRKRNFPLRSKLSSVGSPYYTRASFLHKILRLLAGKLESFIKNFNHFI